MAPSTPASPPRRKRPRSVTFFALVVLYLGMVNLARAWLALNGSAFERMLPLKMPLIYLGLCGLVWGCVFIVAAFGVWQLWAWARRGMFGAILAYQLHVWANHFIFDTSLYARQVWPFQAGLSMIWIAVVWGFLFLPGIKRLYEF